jgi:hypothetical protein
MSVTQGPSSYPGMNAGKSDGQTMPGRKWFSLREHMDRWIRKIEFGILFVLPLAIATYSLRLALTIVAVEIISCWVGDLIFDFDQWYNGRPITAKDVEREKDPAPTTELDAAIARLRELNYGYPISVYSLYQNLQADTIPFGMDNLDWLEIVSLLNTLSLSVGKRFENENEKGITQ